MNQTKAKRMDTKTMVLCAVFTALVVILQLLGSFIKLGPFSISLVLIPIVLGAATCGVGAGAWLGFIFGVTVLASGDAGAFLTVNVIGTVITVLAKGILCGWTAGIVFKSLERFNRYGAVIASAIVCPVVNTGIFLLGCLAFFMPTIEAWAAGADLGGGVAHYIIFVLVGANFLVELASNIILSPVIVRLINIRKNNN